MQKLKDSNKMLLIFKVKRKQTVRLGHNKKRLNYKKRATIELCAASIIAAVATRKWNRNGHISKWSKKIIKAYGKKKGYSYIYGTGDVCLYAEDKYDITKIS
jgi:Skp family chaperone for outer membrane proteins